MGRVGRWFAKRFSGTPRIVGYSRDDVLGLNTVKETPALGGIGRPHRRERTIERIGRNSPCPCGSGRKFKACHGHNRKARMHWEKHRGFDDAS